MTFNFLSSATKKFPGIFFLDNNKSMSIHPFFKNIINVILKNSLFGFNTTKYIIVRLWWISYVLCTKIACTLQRVYREWKKPESNCLVYLCLQDCMETASKTKMYLNQTHLVRNPVQAALPSNKRQKTKFFLEYFWLGRTLRPEGSRNLF